eukprot:COSAG01_NODE_5190_length_4422_cov_4.461022_3_plen_235_part_00
MHTAHRIGRPRPAAGSSAAGAAGRAAVGRAAGRCWRASVARYAQDGAPRLLPAPSHAPPRDTRTVSALYAAEAPGRRPETLAAAQDSSKRRGSGILDRAGKDLVCLLGRSGGTDSAMGKKEQRLLRRQSQDGASSGGDRSGLQEGGGQGERGGRRGARRLTPSLMGVCWLAGAPRPRQGQTSALLRGGRRHDCSSPSSWRGGRPFSRSRWPSRGTPPEHSCGRFCTGSALRFRV